MSFGEKLNTWSGVLKNVLIIGVIVLAVFYLGVSTYANLTENREAGQVSPPDVKSARWEVTVDNTGYRFYARNYETVVNYETGAKKYTLTGYYLIEDGKYKFRDATFILDEYYYGPITVTDRGRK